MDKKKHIHGFKTPEAYFANLEDRLMQKISEEQLPKTHGMQVPEQYFDVLEESIMSQVEKPKQPKQTGIIRYLIPAIGMAAAVLAFIFWIIPSNTSENLAHEASFETEYLDYYVEEFLEDIPENSLYEFADELLKNWNLEDFIDPKEIEEYLMENADLSTLLSYD